MTISTSGRYYILASALMCETCGKFWHADEPQWLEKLPKRLSNIVAAFLTQQGHLQVCHGGAEEQWQVTRGHGEEADGGSPSET